MFFFSYLNSSYCQDLDSIKFVRSPFTVFFNNFAKILSKALNQYIANPGTNLMWQEKPKALNIQWFLSWNIISLHRKQISRDGKVCQIQKN